MRSITEEFKSLFAADNDMSPQEQEQEQEQEGQAIDLYYIGTTGDAVELLEKALANANPDTPLSEDALALAQEAASLLDQDNLPVIGVSLEDEDPDNARIIINLQAQDENELLCVQLAVAIDLSDPEAYVVGRVLFGDAIDQCTVMCVVNKINKDHFGTISAYAEENQGWEVNLQSGIKSISYPDLALRLLGEAMLITESFDGLFTL